MIATQSTYASESSRWYSQSGVSIESVTGKNGNERKPTVRDARKEGWIPSVTSILQIMAKPELENWKLREVAKTGGKYHQGDGEPDEDYAARVVEKAKEEMSLARENGSEVHGQIDRMLLSKQEDIKRLVVEAYPDSRYTLAARTALIDLGVWPSLMTVEEPFCANGVAGKMDLRGLQEPWIVDWKTTNRPLDDGKVPDYDDYLIQLSAYSMGFYHRIIPCHNVFLSTSIPGNYAIRTWSDEELEWGWEAFEACRKLWQLKNHYTF